MQKRHFSVIIAIAFLIASLVLIAGCAKQATVVQPEEQPQVVPQPEQPAAEADADKAAKEKALKEDEKERLLAEKEKAAAAKDAALSPLAGMDFIYFDYDKYAISTEARDTLKKIADKLTASPDMKIRIEGNCDERGTVEYNLALGERRANAAMKYLATLGIKEDRLSTLSNGKEKPVAEGSTEEAWTKNRNAHFIVKK